MNDDIILRWQRDEDVETCFLCGSHYNFFTRRHHCRKCGRVVCGSCSDQPIRYFPRTLVVGPSGARHRAHASEMYRTCDECVDEIRMIRSALMEPNMDDVDDDSRESIVSEASSNRQYNHYNTNPNDTNPNDNNSVTKYSRTRTSTRRLDSSTNSSIDRSNRDDDNDNDSDHNLCPVCAIDMLNIYVRHHKKNIGDISPDDFETFKETHVSECLTSFDFDRSHSRYTNEGSSRPHPRNKMLVFNMPPIPKPKFETIPRNDVNSSNVITGTSYDTVTSMGNSVDSNSGNVSIHTVQQSEKPLPEDTSDDVDNECVICLEELRPGDKVGRLECLCVFHYKCIKDWFNKKGYGECPVHYLQH